MMLNGIQIPESLNKLPEDSIPNNTQIGITANIRRIVARYGVYIFTIFSVMSFK